MQWIKIAPLRSATLTSDVGVRMQLRAIQINTITIEFSKIEKGYSWVSVHLPFLVYYIEICYGVRIGHHLT